MKIIIITNSLFNIFNFRMDLIRNLQRNDFEVYVTCPSKCNILKSSKSEIRKFFKENNIKFIPLEINRSSFNFLSDIFNFFKLYRFIKKEKMPLM